jgi:hypothetical protein
MDAEAIVRLTRGFRSGSSKLPVGFYDWLATRGIAAQRAVLINASSAEQGENPLSGLLLTEDRRFFDFDLDFDHAGLVVRTIHQWTDVTSLKNLSRHNPGFCKGLGASALAVLADLAQVAKA